MIMGMEQKWHGTGGLERICQCQSSYHTHIHTHTQTGINLTLRLLWVTRPWALDRILKSHFVWKMNFQGGRKIKKKINDKDNQLHSLKWHMLSTAFLSAGSLSHRCETNGIRGLIGFITFFLPQTAFKAIRWIIYQSNLGLCWSVGVRAHRGAHSGYLGCSPNGTWVLWDECWVTWRVGGRAHLNFVSGERKDWRDEGR